MLDENGKRVKIVARENTGGEDVREKKKKKDSSEGLPKKIIEWEAKKG